MLIGLVGLYTYLLLDRSIYLAVFLYMIDKTDLRLYTLLKTNMAREDRPSQKDSSSNHPFSDAILVSGRVDIHTSIHHSGQFINP